MMAGGGWSIRTQGGQRRASSERTLIRQAPRRERLPEDAQPVMNSVRR